MASDFRTRLGTESRSRLLVFFVHDGDDAKFVAERFAKPGKVSAEKD
jgi:hypothetical protein